MTPSDYGLPDDAPWYGARGMDDEAEWTILETLYDAVEMYQDTTDDWYISNLGSDHTFEIAAFREANEEERQERNFCEEDNGCRLIAGPVKVVAEVTVRKVEE